MLYQLSYSRLCLPVVFGSLIPAYHRPLRVPDLRGVSGGESRIRTYEAVKQQIYSLPPLATWVSPHGSAPGANGGTRTHDRLITNQLLYQLSYIGLYIKGKNVPYTPDSNRKGRNWACKCSKNRIPTKQPGPRSSSWPRWRYANPWDPRDKKSD